MRSNTPDAALTEDWLTRTGTVEDFYAGLRDTYAPGKPMWLTETGQTACGGDRWASTFLDTFRYLDQLGRLAKRNVQVVMHNTLAASDYGLIDEKTLIPRPNYWAALLWHNTMGTTVLDAGAAPSTSVHLYAQCMKNHPGGVTLLAINLNRTDAQTLTVPEKSTRYTLTATDLMSHSVQLNGKDLHARPQRRRPHPHRSRHSKRFPHPARRQHHLPHHRGCEQPCLQVRDGMRYANNFGRKFLLAAIASMAIAIPRATAQPSPAPQVKLEFDVASVKQNKSDSNVKSTSNIPLTQGHAYSANGGVFSATNQSLFIYILFAYKVSLTEAWDQFKQLPRWARTESFDIHAKTDLPDPTKDQMRQMMQSLLEDRFKLAVHRETRQVPIFALTLAKPGKLGPQLKPHPADSPCTTESPNKPSAVSAPVSTLLGVWPDQCGDGDEIGTTRRMRAGARDMNMAHIAGWLSGEGDTDLPIVDKTGLSGTFDLIIEFAPQHGPSTNADPSIPTFQNALSDQLGLKLEKQKGDATFFVIDHVEEPSEN